MQNWPPVTLHWGVLNHSDSNYETPLSYVLMLLLMLRFILTVSVGAGETYDVITDATFNISPEVTPSPSDTHVNCSGVVYIWAILPKRTPTFARNCCYQSNSFSYLLLCLLSKSSQHVCLD